MRRGSVIVDISNDYGCIETFHETTHEDPIYGSCAKDYCYQIGELLSGFLGYMFPHLASS